MDTLSIKGIFEVFVNNWVPGIFTFFLGICYSNFVEKKKLKQKLKNDILEIFIPVFNAGNEISFEIADNACRNMRGTFQSYKRIYPGIFNKEAESELEGLLKDGFLINGEVNQHYFEPANIEELIKRL
ncbi:hypothetical protein B1L79_12780 [Salmonella enterica subsp. enterica serovar Dublin]|uniref:Uncharacterized protein n=4 Tax=Salmonella enterica TaxID=28901 RepID=A0A5T3FH53_SALER|nr:MULTISPECIES: hypothetical protein [Enterobacteriaceae]EAM4214903.1 hypothetical protein [Salmonella enterica]EBH8522308.1 hypothetical protein [Salmonella enterica subsp. enterica serovar Typhi str. CR0044]EDQ0156626.1 hypothetical protein [Salmonella enterica subsp. enterica serovar Meleagridis]EFA8564641.1 hypothetical protein [Escherichia coli O157]EHQ7554830.1 hypothetical protein [Salmonella enterica subsp. enterica]EKA5906002.1 hypothetical protein [Salmonella enterica subsp. enteri